MKTLLPLLLFALVDSFSASAKKIDSDGINPVANTQVVDISGNYAIVGVPFYKSLPAADKTGEVYLFFKDTSGWKMQAKLTPPDADGSYSYGSAVAINGDYCVVGNAKKTIGTHQSQGKIYIYKRNGNAWTLESTQIEKAGNSGDEFGYSVDISINSANLMVIAVGAPGANNGKGQVYTFARNNTENTWYCSQSIAPADLTTNNKFGFSVSLDKDYLAVGAPNQDYAVYDIIGAGAAYIFVAEEGMFTQQQKMAGYYPDAGFGYSVALAGTKLAVSSSVTNNDDGGRSTASIFVLKRTGSVWDDAFSDIVTLRYGKKNNVKLGIQLHIDDNQLLVGGTSTINAPTIDNPPISDPLNFAYRYITSDGGNTYQLKQTSTNNISFPNNFNALNVLNRKTR